MSADRLDSDKDTTIYIYLIEFCFKNLWQIAFPNS